ncbi:MAG: hypothetical protein V3T14_04830, partial [Myxococcota bacterium]
LANLTAYAYLLDLQRASADAGSTNTYGASIEGSKAVGKAKLGYYLEFARQDNAARSTTSYNANYYHVKGTAKIQNVTVGVAREVLGNGNGFGFSTPLATLHKWDGFADKFLTTPADGIEDNYVLAAVPLPWGVKLKAFIHHFHAESGKNSYGHEYDVVLAKEFPRGIKALVKGMFYEADDNAPNFALTDTSKVALQLEYRWPPNPKKR